MPLYDFHCPNCDNDFEIKLSISEVDNKQTCINCADTDLVRSISSPHISTAIIGRRRVPAEFNNLVKKIHKDAGTKHESKFSATSMR